MNGTECEIFKEHFAHRWKIEEVLWLISRSRFCWKFNLSTTWVGEGEGRSANKWGEMDKAKTVTNSGRSFVMDMRNDSGYTYKTQRYTQGLVLMLWSMFKLPRCHRQGWHWYRILKILPHISTLIFTWYFIAPMIILRTYVYVGRFHFWFKKPLIENLMLFFFVLFLLFRKLYMCSIYIHV